MSFIELTFVDGKLSKLLNTSMNLIYRLTFSQTKKVTHTLSLFNSNLLDFKMILVCVFVLF